MDFFDRVKSLAKARQTTIESLLASCNISRNTYNTWNRNGRLPRAEELIAIARKLGVSVEFLIDGADSQYSGQNETARQMVGHDRIEDLIEALDSMDDASLTLLRPMILAAAGARKSKVGEKATKHTRRETEL